MIKIDEVKDRLTVPVIDFKFQNTGDATALIWQFDIEILESQLDPTPTFDFGFSSYQMDDNFSYDVNNKHLQIHAINQGYGPAKNCEILLEEPSLSEIYSTQERIFKGSINAGEKKTIIDLEPKEFTNEFITAFGKLVSDRPPGGLVDSGKPFEDRELFRQDASGKTEHIIQKMPKKLIPLRRLNIDWKCLSSENRIVNGHGEAKDYTTLGGDSHPYTLYLTELGFFSDYHWMSKMALPSGGYTASYSIRTKDHIDESILFPGRFPQATWSVSTSQ